MDGKSPATACFDQSLPPIPSPTFGTNDCFFEPILLVHAFLGLIQQKRLDIEALRDCWEAFQSYQFIQ